MENKVKANITAQTAHRTEVNDRIRFAAKSDIDDVFKSYSTCIKGLTEEQVEINRDSYGDNKIVQGRRKSLIRKLAESFINPFTLILIALAAVSSVTDIVIPIMNGEPQDVDVMTAVIIIAMIIISGILGFVQETRSGNAAASLLSMITTTASVQREEDGVREIELDEIVAGDIVHLAAGDMIPADIRIFRAKDFFVSQSALTGESEPIEKIGSKVETDNPTECNNLSFMGSNVISGTASAVVIATGNDTMFGSVAKSVSTEDTATGFEKGVHSVSWVLIRFMLIMVPIVFVLNGLTKHDWLGALFFGISIAVGLTPEMLPMIVTTCLAKGAVAMSKKKTIIKSLNSIQNFGAMDILCTDKTGTITMDKVVLQYYMDVRGNDNTRVLKHAFLNSYYQTGLKNLMDISIIERTAEESEEDISLKGLSALYEKVDEIPFDFNRRMMSVVVADKNGKTQMITKGAVEEVLDACSHVEYKGVVKDLTEELKIKVLKTVDDLNDDGMRVIAVAQKTNPSNVGAFSVKDESDMVLMGYMAFLDPPKESTAAAINALMEHGVTTKVLTGDNDKVTRCICKQVGLRVDNLLLGSDVDKMSHEELKVAVENTNVFAKLSPSQKEIIVTQLRENGYTVGFMGDGINDAAAMKAADIGISVDTAVDIAKESANIILLEKDLMVLEEGIIEGRKTYANMIKYIKMTASSNFGNMFSVLAASAFLPFLPMLSIHILLLNLIYDISCAAIPWDNVDDEYLKVPRQWNPSSISSFMCWIGPTSSVFDITTYLLMYFIICPHVVGISGADLNFKAAELSEQAKLFMAVFQAGWFVESMWSQTLVIHMIRTPKIPFIQSRASFPVFTLTFAGILTLTAIPFTWFGEKIGLTALPFEYFGWLAATIVLYMILVTILKNLYVKRYGELL